MDYAVDDAGADAAAAAPFTLLTDGSGVPARWFNPSTPRAACLGRPTSMDRAA